MRVMYIKEITNSTAHTTACLKFGRKDTDSSEEFRQKNTIGAMRIMIATGSNRAVSKFR